MYYMLEKKAFDDPQPLATLGDAPNIDGVNWHMGTRFTRDIPQPLRCELNPNVPGAMPWFFKSMIPLMHEKMLAALREAGVDSLDLYDALVVDPEDGSEWTEYKAVNIIGMVSATDRAKSRFDANAPSMVAMRFDSLELDEKKTGGALMFRLAECTTGIVVHQKVKDVLVAREVLPLGFIEPKQWIS